MLGGLDGGAVGSEGAFVTWSPLRDGVRRRVVLAGLLVMGLTAPLGSATIGLAVMLLMLPLLYREAKGDGESSPLTAFGVLGMPALALIASALISTLFAGDVVHSLGHVVGMAIMAAVGLLGARIAVREREFLLKIVMPVVIVATVASAAWGIYEYFVLDVRRATAFVSYTNRLATLLVFFGVLGSGFLMQRRDRVSWLLFPYGLLTLAGIGATMSRAGWVAAALGIVLLGLRGGKRFLVVFLIAALLFGMFLVVEDKWAARFKTIFSVDSNQDRIVLWVAALNIFRDHPVVGTGPGSFLEVGKDYIESVRSRNHATPHNVVLSIASDLGLLGLLAFGWLMGRAGQAALYLWRRGGAFYTGLVAAVVCIFVNDLFGQGFYTTQTGTIMWFGLGLLAAFYELERESTPDGVGEPA